MTDTVVRFAKNVTEGLKTISDLCMVLCEAFSSHDKKLTRAVAELAILQMKLKDRDADVMALRAQVEALIRAHGWPQ